VIVGAAASAQADARASTSTTNTRSGGGERRLCGRLECFAIKAIAVGDCRQRLVNPGFG
jgi:hypothetical protein